MSTMPENSATGTGEQPEVALGLVPGTPEPAPGTAGQATATPAAPEGEPPQDWRAAYPELAAKFADPAKMAAAYARLERRFHDITRLGYTPEQAADILAGISPPPEPGTGETAAPGGEEAEAAPPERPDPAQFLDAFADDPIAALDEYLTPMIDRRVEILVGTRMLAEKRWADAVARYPDIAKYEREMAKVLEVAPGLAEFPDAIDRIYRMVASGTPPAAAIAQAKEQARAEGIAQVTGTFMESGRGGSSPPVAGKPAAERVADEILGAGGGQPALQRL
jgi:hypothetical protein